MSNAGDTAFMVVATALVVLMTAGRRDLHGHEESADQL